MSEAYISAKGVGKVFLGAEGQVIAVHGVSLDIQSGEFVALIGPSGCGKSTFLHILAGLLSFSEGEITLGGRPIKGSGRERGVVFQEFALFPWLTVADNIAFGLRLRSSKKMSSTEISKRVTDLVEMVHLQGFQHRKPNELSGGMKQRVALASCLASDPEVLLMDEPFGALDAQTRGVLQRELMRICEETKKTVVFVTHDIREAILLADRVVVMTARPGTIKRVLPVTLPRPRWQRRQEFSQEFLDLSAQMNDLLEEEINKAMVVGQVQSGS